LINEMCRKQGVQFYKTKMLKKKAPPSALFATFKEKRVIVKRKPMQPVQERWMRRMKFAWKF